MVKRKCPSRPFANRKARKALQAREMVAQIEFDPFSPLPTPMHPDGWGRNLIGTIPSHMELVTAGRLARTVAQHCVVAIRGLGEMTPQQVLAFVTDAMGADPRPPPAPKGWPAPLECPQIHLLGSPGSGGEFIPAHSKTGDDDDSSNHMLRWIESPSARSVTTDWHVDEPWEENPARFTVLYAAQSQGDVRTRFASTAHFWNNGMSAEDQELCEASLAEFEPPPWLPQEQAVSIHPLVRHTLAGKAMYVCADSLRAVDGMSREESIKWCWKLTQQCCSKEHVAEHHWEKYDLLVLDNFSSLHSRVKYNEQRQNRLLYRLRLDGAPESR